MCVKSVRGESARCVRRERVCVRGESKRCVKGECEKEEREVCEKCEVHEKRPHPPFPS